MTEVEEPKSIHDFETDRIKWENVIFIPFHPVFRFIVFCASVLKVIMGPLASIQRSYHCERKSKVAELMREADDFVKFIYLVDIISHVIHRQVRDTAVRRPHLPKPVHLLLLDVISVIPFFTMASRNICTDRVSVYPNILAFSEVFCIYRVAEYFALFKTHNLFNDLVAISMLLVLWMHILRCLWFLLTTEGLCIHCNWYSNFTYPDWRATYVNIESKADFVLHALNYVFSRFFTTKATVATYAVTQFKTYALGSFYLLLGYSVKLLILVPKMFQEAIIGNGLIHVFQKRVDRIITIVKRRTENTEVIKNISKFYDVMWTKKSGTLKVPPVYHELPKYLAIEIKLDLFWAVFYHSPTFRNTTVPYQRWLSENIRFELKMRGEKLYSGPQCHGNLYFLKTGIVQLLSLDDNATPILSLTSGTLLGDINFCLPALTHKITARCVTNCEIQFISRKDILRSLHKFPEDRKAIMSKAKERVKHARLLYGRKYETEEDLDRIDCEGIAWLKRRWWQIRYLLSDALINPSTKKDVEIPAEETEYHCSKYIGQLVLYNEAYLFNTSIFVSTTFPWILSPDSTFLLVWQGIVKATTVIVLIFYPPILRSVNSEIDFSFKLLQFWTDCIFICDIFIGIATRTKQDENLSLATAILGRFKEKQIFLDILSTSLIGHVVRLMDLVHLDQVCQFSRLIKLHIFLKSDDFELTHLKSDLFVKTMLMCFILVFSYLYIGAYFVHLLTEVFENLSKSFFFCKLETKVAPELRSAGIVLRYWLSSFLTKECPPLTNTDVYFMNIILIMGFLILLYVNGTMIAIIYFQYEDKVNFQFAVANTKNHFIHYKIHPSLLKRIQKYINAQWKSIDIVHNLKTEPYSIYHSMHDKVAESIIYNSRAFYGADLSFIKEVAHRVQYRILPKFSTLFLLGSQCRIVSWCVNGIIQLEYIDDRGNMVSKPYPHGELLSVGSVFFGEISLRTYVASTDCEIMYISLSQFRDILQRYPNELELIRMSQREVAPYYEKIMAKYIYQQERYRRRLLMNRHQSMEFREDTDVVKFLKRDWWRPSIKKLISNMWINPTSKYWQKWLALRAVVVILSITAWTQQGALGAEYRRTLRTICSILDVFAGLDIILKLFLGYFDDYGIIINDRRKCAKRYLTRTFLVDLFGTMPWHELVGENFTVGEDLLLMVVLKCFHLYIVNGYFNYMANKPDSNILLITVVKFQIIGIVVIFINVQIEVVRCVDMLFDLRFNLQKIGTNPKCFPSTNATEITRKKFKNLYLKLVLDKLESFTRYATGARYFTHTRPLTFLVSCMAHILYWIIYIFCVAIFVLNFRGNSLYQDGIRQLKTFLEEERVERSLIKRAVNHFTYLHARDNGVNTKNIVNDENGFVLKQDVSYYFYKKTLSMLSESISLAPHVRRALSVSCDMICFLPGEDVIREMDVLQSMYIVHRGKMAIYKDGVLVEYVTKGAIFGQLLGNRLRPVKISVKTFEPADALVIPAKRFKEVISDKQDPQPFEGFQTNGMAPVNERFVDERTTQHFIDNTTT